MKFFRKPDVEAEQSPELTNASYSRWLRAQKPPLAMFLGMSEIEQEALAVIGDEHLADFATAIGYAVAADHKEASRAPDIHGDMTVSSDESLALRLASAFAAKLTGATAAEPTDQPPAPVSMPRESLAGFGDRRREEHDHNEPRRPSLFGRTADDSEAAAS